MIMKPATTSPDSTTDSESSQKQKSQHQSNHCLAEDQQFDTEKGLDAPIPEAEPPFSTFSITEKKLIIVTISFIGLISPLSASIYFPAINTLADDLHVSTSDINLTITTYLVSLSTFLCHPFPSSPNMVLLTPPCLQIFQALGPTLFGNLSDVKGRRPAYILCLAISVIVNIGLAFQTSYPALLVLRCIQSTGCAPTVALGSAVVADLSTRDERGKWITYAGMGMMLGPALGPLIGGLLDKYLGWRAIFVFLAIFAGALLLVVLIALPETCRAVVSNGSVAAQPWNRTLWSYMRGRKGSEQSQTNLEQAKPKRPNPIASLLICLRKEDGSILLCGALLYGGFYVVLVTLTGQLSDRYGFNTLQIGLCYIPFGVGAMASRFSVGILLDRNYKRLSAQHLASPSTTATEPQSQLSKEDPTFPVEKARLQIGIPTIFLSALTLITYGWVMHFRTSLAGPLILLFLIGNFTTGAFNVFSTLIMDINLKQPATAAAANNLARCGVGAAFTAFAQPLVNKIGIGWTGTVVAGLWVLMTPALWAVVKWGPKWRAGEKVRKEEK